MFADIIANIQNTMFANTIAKINVSNNTVVTLLHMNSNSSQACAVSMHGCSSVCKPVRPTMCNHVIST